VFGGIFLYNLGERKMSIWMNQRVRTYDVVNPDNYGEIGTVVGTAWSEDPDSGEDMMAPTLLVKMDNGTFEWSFVRDCQLVILDGEDA